MIRVIVEGVRCFQRRQMASLGPLTVLVGENSTGKSTFLALVRLGWDLALGASVFDFNEEPFPLGAYEQIASKRGPRGGRVRSFSVGLEVQPEDSSKGGSFQTMPVTIVGTFVRGEPQPSLEKWSLMWRNYHAELILSAKERPRLTFHTPSGSMTVISSYDPRYMLGAQPLIDFLRFIHRQPRTRSRDFRIIGQRPSRKELTALNRVLEGLIRTLGPRPSALAPTRTRPLRTYNPIRDDPSPEGAHAPMILASAFSSDPKGWKRIQGWLGEFGGPSGLFERISVRRFGRTGSDPFQIEVTISGSPFNLVDVGYGVSQSLPIVVDAIRVDERSTLLLQQPEIHLHPKAQAQLGTFFSAFASRYDQRFVIETHSDHLIDRIRMDARKGKLLKTKDISMLFFERKGRQVTVHRLELDEFGNIVTAPKGYRAFFLNEEKRMLGN